MLQGLQNELDKLKGRVQNEGHAVNLAQVNKCAGSITKSQNITTVFYAASDDFGKLGPDSWIIDTGATTHMCANPKLFFNSSKRPKTFLSGYLIIELNKFRKRATLA